MFLQGLRITMAIFRQPAMSKEEKLLLCCVFADLQEGLAFRQVQTHPFHTTISIFLCFFMNLILHWSVVYGLDFTVIMEMSWNFCICTQAIYKIHEQKCTNNAFGRKPCGHFSFHLLLSLGFWKRKDEDEKDVVNM